MIIDFHTHIFPRAVAEQPFRFRSLDPGFREMYSSPQARIATAEELVEAMDVAGVQIAVVSAFGWARHDLCVQHNDTIVDAVQRYPERLVGLFALASGHLPRALQEIERCAEAGLKGVGELRLDAQGWDQVEPSEMDTLVEALHERRLLLLLHASEPVGHTYPGKGAASPPRLERFLRRYPHLTVVLAHWGGGLPFYSLMPEVREVLARAYVDTAATPYLYSPQVYRVVAQLLGSERILFGSDFPLLPYRRALEHLEAGGLTPEEREQVLQSNARRLLGMEAEEKPPFIPDR